MYNQRALRLKERLRAGEPALGIWLNIPSPVVSEIIAGAGFDWALVDAEHAPFDPVTLHQMLMGFKGTDTVPAIRVAANDEVRIKQALDLGFEGIVTPQTNTADEARRAVAACRYPPDGIRGSGPTYASNYGRDVEEYERLANQSIFCIIQVESIHTTAEIDEIVTIPGIDGVIVGPNDMSGTAGCFRDLDNAELQGAIRTILGTAREAGIAVGHGFSVDGIAQQIEDGAQLILAGEDIELLVQGAEDVLREFRAARTTSCDN
jgi:2-keto-3-deoxy-L-rhamnonate aldolase RhmA